MTLQKPRQTVFAVVFVVLLLSSFFAVVPVSAASCPAGEEVYQVRYGDTLSHIANLYKNYGVTVTSLRDANGIGNVNLIYWGGQLCVGIPAVAVPVAGSADCDVQWGYTLSGIAYATGATLRAIRENARIANPDWIFAGETILIPPPAAGCS
jgi:nucleoid-associated protein YgaU